MNRVALIVGALVAIPLLVFLAMGFNFDPHYIDSPLVGKPAPRFSLVDLDGNLVRLEDLLGQPVVINFWATYCVPCIYEHGTLQAAARRHEGEVHFIGVIYQDDPRLIRRFLEERGTWGPSLIDEGGEVAMAYGVYGPPETFFIDRDGIIAEKVIGQVYPDVMARILETLLRGRFANETS